MARCGTSPRCQASGETEETSDARNAPPKEIFVAFAQHLLFFKAMPWEDAESLHKQLHAAFGCGRPPALRKFVDEISDFLRPTGLKVRKVFCDGSRSSTAFLILHSEAEEELPVSLSALRTLQRVSKKFSLTQLHIFQAAASYLLRTRQPLTLLQWIRLCQAKGGCAPSLLQSLLELQFLRVENAEGDPTQLRLVLGPWCYAEKLRSLEALMPDAGVDGFACTHCRLPAIFSALRCGSPSCSAQFHRECLLFLSSLWSASEAGGRQRGVSSANEREEDIRAEAQTRAERRREHAADENEIPRVCPACEGVWGSVLVRGGEEVAAAREAEDR
uniref:Uncharacterized protein n=3 Tax=Toxoplasma gondii TaxID=5811 RepID=A0A0F7VDU9_TOXGV|nr:TPA: hypothetical protein BN1205_070420 [Toxoplasma gondii VEG]